MNKLRGKDGQKEERFRQKQWHPKFSSLQETKIKVFS